MSYERTRWSGSAWILANALGLAGALIAGALAALLAEALTRVVATNQLAGILSPLAGTATAGAVLGGAQQWVLRRSLPELAGWVRASVAAGMLAGVALMLIFGLLPAGPNRLGYLITFTGELGVMIGAVVGITLGVAQWRILRRYVRRAGWLVPAIIVGTTLGLVIGIVVNMSIQPRQIGGDFIGLWMILPAFVIFALRLLVAGFIAGVISGALSGIALTILLPAQSSPAVQPRRWLNVGLSLAIVLLTAGPIGVSWYRGRPERTLIAGEHARSIAFSPDGQTIATGDDSGMVKLWRVSDGTFLHAFKGHRSDMMTIAFSPEGLFLAGGGGLRDNTIKLWHAADGALLETFSGHSGGAGILVFSPDGRTLVSAGSDNTIKLWRVFDGMLLRTLSHGDNRLWGVTFSPDGQILAAGSADGMVIFWRASDGAVVQTLKGAGPEIGNVTFSPDGQLLASGAYQAVQLWRVQDGTSLWKFPVDPGPVSQLGYEGSHVGDWSAVFSPDGQTLATITGSGTARLWRVSDGTLLRTFEDDLYAQDIAFDADGKLLAIADWNGAVKFWRVAP